jgi:hypothetical protein
MLNIFNKRLNDYLQSETRDESYNQNWMKLYEEGVMDKKIDRKFETLVKP